MKTYEGGVRNSSRTMSDISRSLEPLRGVGGSEAKSRSLAGSFLLAHFLANVRSGQSSCTDLLRHFIRPKLDLSAAGHFRRRPETASKYRDSTCCSKSQTSRSKHAPFTFTFVPTRFSTADRRVHTLKSSQHREGYYRIKWQQVI
jgi:hypothetical protein